MSCDTSDVGVRTDFTNQQFPLDINCPHFISVSSIATLAPFPISSCFQQSLLGFQLATFTFSCSVNSWSKWSINPQKKGFLHPFTKMTTHKMGQNDCSHIPISPTNTTSIPNNHNGSKPITPRPWNAIGFVIFWKDWTTLLRCAHNPALIIPKPTNQE